MCLCCKQCLLQHVSQNQSTNQGNKQTKPNYEQTNQPYTQQPINILYLYVVCLTTLSIAQIIQHPMLEWSMNEWEIIRKEAAMDWIKVLSQHQCRGTETSVYFFKINWRILQRYLFSCVSWTVRVTLITFCVSPRTKAITADWLFKSMPPLTRC
jgi:hypothetical protein